MGFAEIIPIAGSIVTTGLGIAGLFKPNVLAESTGLAATNELGMMELRALFGGAFLVLGLSALLFRQPEIYLVAGMVLVGASLVKIISLSVDRPPVKLAVPGILFDLMVGLAVASGYFFS